MEGEGDVIVAVAVDLGCVVDAEAVDSTCEEVAGALVVAGKAVVASDAVVEEVEEDVDVCLRSTAAEDVEASRAADEDGAVVDEDANAVGADVVCVGASDADVVDGWTEDDDVVCSAMLVGDEVLAEVFDDAGDVTGAPTTDADVDVCAVEVVEGVVGFVVVVVVSSDSRVAVEVDDGRGVVFEEEVGAWMAAEEVPSPRAVDAMGVDEGGREADVVEACVPVAADDDVASAEVVCADVDDDGDVFPSTDEAVGIAAVEDDGDDVEDGEVLGLVVEEDAVVWSAVSMDADVVCAAALLVGEADAGTVVDDDDDDEVTSGADVLS